jgi:hypothetical protein
LLREQHTQLFAEADGECAGKPAPTLPGQAFALAAPRRRSAGKPAPTGSR